MEIKSEGPLLQAETLLLKEVNAPPDDTAKIATWPSRVSHQGINAFAW
jgi:hypothetical protein